MPTPSPARRAILLLLTTLLLSNAGPQAEADDEMARDGWSRRELFLDGITLEFFEQGQGTAVLMLPSRGRPAQDFRDLGARVADAGHRVICINPRGIGASEGPLAEATLHDLAADVWNVADALSIERAFLLGQDFGSRVCRAASADQPDRVIGLMLLACGGEIGPEDAALAAFDRVFQPDLPPARHLEAVARSCFAPGNDPSAWKDGWSGETARLQADVAQRTASDAVRSGGTAPVLVIQGLQDVIAPPENAWHFVRRRPRARLVALPDTGHAMLPEQPEALAAAVLDFLQEQRARDRDTQELGRRLYGLVEAYAGLGLHRVGTDVDARTIEWFAAELERRGASVRRAPFRFERFDGASSVSIDGKPVPSMPLSYEGTGNVETDAPDIVAVDVLSGDRTSKALQDAIFEARAAGAKVLVVATGNPIGALQTPNRAPGIGTGLPVVLVPGAVAEALRAGPVHVRFHGRMAPGRSANVIASFGDTSKRPIVVATPLSGWFACAAERGTGIAIALELAADLSRRHPVVVVGSSGHELLPHIGLQTFLREHDLDPRLVVHLGANVALGEKDPTTGRMRLVPGTDHATHAMPAARTLFVRLDPKAFEAVAPALSSIDLPAVRNPREWSGEGALWADAVDGPLLSFGGAGPRSHTPADVPAAVTGPALLVAVLDAIRAAVDRWERVAGD